MDSVNKNEKILIEYRKKKSFKQMPKRIIKGHERIKREFKQKQREKDKHSNKLENRFSFMEPLVINKKKKPVKCSALKDTYKRCTVPARFNYIDFNDGSLPISKSQRHMPFCPKHAKLIAESKDKKSLTRGFWYESDIYNPRSHRYQHKKVAQKNA